MTANENEQRRRTVEWRMRKIRGRQRNDKE
jgi:hypothetical protein